MTALLLALLALPCQAARPSRVPEPADLLRRTLEPSAPSYEGLLRVETSGRPARRVRVRFQAPGRYRREALDDSGRPEHLVVSDGGKEWVYDLKRAKAWEGEPAAPEAKQLGTEEQLELLAANYELRSATAAAVAGRSCWLLELRARADRRLRRRLWIDRGTGLTLASESFAADGALASATRFEKLSARRQAKAWFAFSPPAGVAVSKRLEPDFLALDEARSAAGARPRLPSWLPSGYVFESLDVIPRGERKIIHFRFSDGVDALSLFQCPPGVVLEGAGAARPPGEETFSWKKGRSRFLLVGALSPEDMRRVAASVR